MSKVAILHPSLQHAYQLAWALNDAGLLSKIITGTPIKSSTDTKPWPLPDALWERLKSAEIPKNRRECHPFWYLAMQVATRVGSHPMRYANMHRTVHAFDRLVSKNIQKLKPKAVIAYENSALHTFREAKKIGAVCILDAASIHYRHGAELIDTPNKKFTKIIDSQKEQEIHLADAIICCSDMAKDTYENAGVDPKKLKTLLLGAELPHHIVGRSKRKKFEKIKFIFAGTLQERKSIDLILEAFSSLKDVHPECHLDIYGRSDQLVWQEKARLLPNVSLYDPISQSSLYERFLESDCLLLPSRFDSFGMVVAEAMAAGTPAIVSTMTGAKAIIEQHPGSGWIIPATTEKIIAIVKEIASNPGVLRDASNKALNAAQHFTWEAYRIRASKLVRELISENSAIC